MQRMRIFFSISILMLAVLACNAVSGLGSGVRKAQTEIPIMMSAAPAMLTSVPTVLGPLETAAAEFTPPAVSTNQPDANGNSPSSSAGLGISLANVRTVMEATQQFTFTDGTVDGNPAVIASLSPSAATSMPGLAGDFSAAFIGDSANLSQIKITMPYSADPGSLEAGLSLVTVVFASILPPDVLLTFIPWMTDNYSKLPVGQSKDLSTGNYKFTLSKEQSVMILDIVPAK